MSVLVFLLLLSFSAAGQSVQAEAPWLTVYDEAGRPKWEVRMRELVRTAAGWEGKDVTVHLYHEGSPQLVLRAPAIRADRYGREWTLISGEPDTGSPVVGEGEGFSFSCNEARWLGGLVLVGLRAEGRGVILSAGEARWDLGQTVHLTEANATFSGWELGFPTGRYDLVSDELVAVAATVRGHGVKLVGATLVAWPKEGKLRVTEAELVPAP